MNPFVSGLILSGLVLLQSVAGVRHRVPSSSSSCISPTGLTYDWQVFAAGTTVATNGSGVNNLVDVIAANNATQSTGGNQPIYTTGAIHSLPAAAFNGSSDTLTLTTPILFSNNLWFFFVVFNLSSTGVNSGIVGGATSGGGLEWRINGSNNQELLNQGVASISAGSDTYTTGTNYATAFSYNQTTGAYALYKISGGSANADGTASTNIQTLTNNLDSLGAAPDIHDWFHGQIIEWGFSSASTSVPTGLGAYISCKYAI